MASEGLGRYRILLLGACPPARSVAEALVDAGFRRIVIVDRSPVTDDDVDGECFLSEDVAIRSRSECLAHFLSYNPEVRATPASSDVHSLEGWNYTLIIGCSDHMSERIRANRFARMYGIPYIDGSVHCDRGRVQTVFPYGPCLECSIGARPAFFSNRGTPGAMKRMAMAVAGEAVKVLSRREDECIQGVLYVDDSEGDDRVVSLGISPACTCHKEGQWQSR